MAIRYFTVAEANAALPRLNLLLQQIWQSRQKITDSQPELWPILRNAVHNGGSKKAGAFLAEFDRLQQAVQQIEKIGALLKDPDIGLIDFLHRQPDGHEVYLCWHYGEPEVVAWHEKDEGFSGRRPF
ncbi:MAG: DUF2203 domain-containing protein [Caldilineales bacterium]